ncbi:MAG: hypothetical protein ACRD4F_10200 [Candidatus Angelobacter sp.]
MPEDARLHEPMIDVTLPPLTWRVTFFISFQDGLTIRIWEFYDRFSRLEASRRVQWSYHYGQYAAGAAASPLKGEPDDPVIIRIDTTSGLHMHYRARDPHYEQSRIKGLDLQSVDCWRFINNVLKHRRTEKPIDEVFGFKLLPK